MSIDSNSPIASGPFQTDADWLAFHSSPRKPNWQPPAGAIDAHCHVFGPGHLFPYAPERKYTPCDAPKEKLFELRHFLGFSRNVIVQATCHGANNDALVDALHHSNNQARGVATVREDISDNELTVLHDAGVRGVRFNFVKRLVDTRPTDALQSIAPRIKSLGWHVVLYFEPEDLLELSPIIAKCPVPVIVDHMARPDVSKAIDGPEFSQFIGLMENNSHVWTKVSCPERLTKLDLEHIEKNSYTDVVPFSKKLVDQFPDRVLWGTDWPHPNMKSHMPDDGQLVELIPLIAPTEKQQIQLLVTNPERLYWADESNG